LRENVPVEDLRESDAKLERLQRHGEAYHHEFRLIMPGGSERWLSGHAAIRSNRIFGVNFDVTQRKRAEAALRDSEERLKTLQEEERQRIAQELHDSTSQHLVAASLNLMRLRSKAGTESDVRLWDEVEDSMQEALKELRTFSYLMHPAALHADGLRSTIRQYVGGYANRSGVTVKFKSNPRVDKLPFQMQRSLFRIIQEALANVHRHASASHVSIELWRIGRRLYLSIADNGHGVDGMSEGQREPLRPGVGIIGIRARVQQLGGELKIETGSHGTKIQAEVPADYAPRKAADLG
jgi:signal transduction histidine kinase